jgi:hypothetical protein
MSRETTTCPFRGCGRPSGLKVASARSSYKMSYMSESDDKVSYPYCLEHRMRQCKGGCYRSGRSCGARQRQDYCEEHRCAVPSCVKEQHYDDLKCTTHTTYIKCKEYQCLGVVRTGCEFCPDHLCKEKGCSEHVSFGGYCRSHTCSVEFCGKQRLHGSQGCKYHRCLAPDCKDTRGLNNPLCYAHRCDRTGCHQMKADGNLYCDIHSIMCIHTTYGDYSSTDCTRPRVADTECKSKYCTAHKCSKPDCPKELECSEHRCKADDCDTLKDAKYDYCDDCRCKVPGCEELWKLPKSRLCIEHADDKTAT